jgi:RHS repeat-associated protein
MKLRQEQFDKMRVPSDEFSRQLRELLNLQGIPAKLDPKSRDLLIPGAEQGTARIRFDMKGRPCWVRSVNGRTHKIEYDDQNRPVTIVDAAGQKICLSFNEDNQITAIIDPTDFSHEFTYKNTLPVEIRRAGVPSALLTVNEMGNPLTITDAKGNAYRFDYNQADRLEKFTERHGAATEYRYDDNVLSSVITPNGAVWQLIEDEIRARKLIIYPDGGADEYEVDGEIVSKIHRRDGKTVELVYDTDFNLTEVAYPDDISVSLGYNENRHITNADNNLHHVLFQYDENGNRVVEEIDSRKLSFHFNDEQLLDEVTTHRGETLSFQYGADQRIKEIRDWDGGRYLIERNANGLVTQLNLSDHVVIQQTFKAQGLLASENMRAGNTVIVRQYQYDENDLLTEMTDSVFGKKQHQFDAEDRITQVISSHLDCNYSYDAHGNLLSAGKRNYQYNLLDQITTGADIDCRYDDLGNLVEWRENGATTRYYYNGQNQLIRVELPDDRIAEYEYDALGRRLVKRVDGITTTYTWWNWQIIAEDIDGPEPSHIDYLFLPGTHRLLAMRVDGQTYYAQTDHLDSPIRLFDSSGHVVWAAEPHGFEFIQTITQVRQPFRFAGQYFDEETGLYYNWNRYYDPKTGRYISPDPLFFEERTNLYLYAANNPARFIDPSGLMPLPFLAIAAIAVGVGALLAGGHKIASDLSQGRSVDWKGAAVAAGKGALAVAGGVAAAAAAVAGSLPALAVGAVAIAGGTATTMLISATTAEEGKRVQACKKTLTGMIPFYNTVTHDYENDPTLTNPNAQRMVDTAFDAIGVVGTLLGIRKAVRTRSPKTGGLENRGYKPKPGERTMTREQWKAKDRARRIKERKTGLETRGRKPKPENRQMTKEEWKKQYRDERIKKNGGVNLKEAVKQSQEAYKRSVAKAKGSKKTVASDGDQTLSGWEGKTNKKQRQDYNNTATPQKVKDYSEQIGHELDNNGFLDQKHMKEGFDGKYHASHAEKQQAILQPNEPIGVSRVMCKCCQGFFKKHAQATGKPQVVTDPEMTRIFHPDGTVESIPLSE